MTVLVLNEVDKLSREAQHSLRRTMEKYSASCRLILCCNSSSKVTEAVRSRCLNIRVNAPTNDQVGISTVLRLVDCFTYYFRHHYDSALAVYVLPFFWLLVLAGYIAFIQFIPLFFFHTSFCEQGLVIIFL